MSLCVNGERITSKKIRQSVCQTASRCPHRLRLWPTRATKVWAKSTEGHWRYRLHFAL